MKKKFQNIFFFFGLVVLVIMATQLDFKEAWEGLLHAGYWFLAVILLWALLYILNTLSWWLIIKSQKTTIQHDVKCDVKCDISHYPNHPISFPWLYKVTVSGFALNYATPGGLMGGEPYRIMELSPKIGTERASSSVILYVMTHIFSHFWFWLLSSLLFIALRPLDVAMGIMISVVISVCLVAIWFFLRGYRKGLAVAGMRLLGKIPGIRRWAATFVNNHRQQLDNIDSQIAALHNQNPRTFVAAVSLELLCRICSALEIYFILLVLSAEVSYADCILILAFTSLFANMLFFMPLQLGGREGGFLMSASGLGLTASAGIFVALIVRLRELVWTAIGLLLIKIKSSSIPALPSQEE